MTALVRAVHFHATPPHRAAEIEAQLAPLAARFGPLGEDDVLHGRGGGLLVCAFNGLRDNATVLAPILDRLGLVGWFFVPSAFVTTPPERQRAFAAARGIRVAPGATDPVAMTPADVARLARRHVIASHTRTHRALAGLGDDELAGSRRELEAMTGRPVRTFAGLHGGGRDADPEAAAALRASGYALLVANHAIQRL